MEIELEEIESRYKNLPSPPWKYCHGNNLDHWEVWSETDGIHLVQDDSGVEPDTEFLEFICHAREDIPRLIAEIRRLKERAKDASDGN